MTNVTTRIVQLLVASVQSLLEVWYFTQAKLIAYAAYNVLKLLLELEMRSISLPRYETLSSKTP